MYRDKIEHYRCDSTLLMKWRVCTLQGWCAIFNDIHGWIKPTDILIMCIAHKWISLAIPITRKVISTILVMGIVWNTLFFLSFYTVIKKAWKSHQIEHETLVTIVTPNVVWRSHFNVMVWSAHQLWCECPLWSKWGTHLISDYFT